MVIDELGKMELASARFRTAFDRLLAGRAALLATVHAFRHPYTDAVLARDDVTVTRLTPGNRERLGDELAAALEPLAADATSM